MVISREFCTALVFLILQVNSEDKVKAEDKKTEEKLFSRHLFSWLRGGMLQSLQILFLHRSSLNMAAKDAEDIS